jgi:hypothetical protein
MTKHAYRSIVFIAFAAFLLKGTPAQAVTSRVGSAQDLGVGVAMGQPFGFTAKYWLNSTTAVDAAMGYHFNSNLDVHADYLFHSFSSFDVASGRLPFYVGIGGRILLGNSSQLGMRVPIGVSYLFPTDPLEAFVEIAPVVRLVTKIGFDVDGIIGVRVYINYLK